MQKRSREIPRLKRLRKWLKRRKRRAPFFFGGQMPGTKPRQVKSLLTGCMIDASKDGYPAGRKPVK